MTLSQYISGLHTPSNPLKILKTNDPEAALTLHQKFDLKIKIDWLLVEFQKIGLRAIEPSYSLGLKSYQLKSEYQSLFQFKPDIYTRTIFDFKVSPSSQWNELSDSQSLSRTKDKNINYKLAFKNEIIRRIVISQNVKYDDILYKLIALANIFKFKK